MRNENTCTKFVERECHRCQADMRNLTNRAYTMWNSNKFPISFSDLFSSGNSYYSKYARNGWCMVPMYRFSGLAMTIL